MSSKVSSIPRGFTGLRTKKVAHAQWLVSPSSTKKKCGRHLTREGEIINVGGASFGAVSFRPKRPETFLNRGNRRGRPFNRRPTGWRGVLARSDFAKGITNLNKGERI